MGPSSCNQLPPRRALPPPSPSWAEVAGGGGVSATSQFEAWLRCRQEGCPAKLVLETDGDSEEVCLWFRRTACAPTEAAPQRRRRRRRPGRDKIRRQRRAERGRTDRSSTPPTMGVVTEARDIGPAPPAVSMEVSSPQCGSPPAKRPRTRAAARAGGQTDAPTPEKSRAARVANPCDLNLSAGEELFAVREEPPFLPPPAPLPPPVTTPPPAT